MHSVAVLHDLMYLGLVWAQPPAAHPATVSAESCRARTKVSHLRQQAGMTWPLQGVSRA